MVHIPKSEFWTPYFHDFWDQSEWLFRFSFKNSASPFALLIDTKISENSELRKSSLLHVNCTIVQSWRHLDFFPTFFLKSDVTPSDFTTKNIYNILVPILQIFYGATAMI